MLVVRLKIYFDLNIYQMSCMSKKKKKHDFTGIIRIIIYTLYIYGFNVQTFIQQ